MHRLGQLAVLLAAAALLYNVWSWREWALGNSRDFLTYYHAAETLQQGGNPYLEGKGPPYVYPPYFARAIAPVTNIAEADIPDKIYWIRVVGLLALCGILLTGWCRRNGERVLVVLLFAFGFNNALRVDFFYSNITVFEQFMLWIGIVLLVHKVPGVHTLTSCLTALVKTTNLALVPIEAVVRRTWASVALVVGGLGAAGAAHFVAASSEPGLYSDFQAAVDKLSKGDYADYSVFTWLRLTFRPEGTGLLEATPISLGSYAAIACLVVGTAIWAIRKANDERLVVCIYLSGFALLAPRFKDYQHLLLVPVAAYLAWNAIKPLPAKLLIGGIFCINLLGIDLNLIFMQLLLFGLAVASAAEKKPQVSDTAT